MFSSHDKLDQVASVAWLLYWSVFWLQINRDNLDEGFVNLALLYDIVTSVVILARLLQCRQKTGADIIHNCNITLFLWFIW